MLISSTISSMFVTIASRGETGFGLAVRLLDDITIRFDCAGIVILLYVVVFKLY